MSYQLIISKRVPKDIQEGYQYYQRKHTPQSAELFVLNVAEIINTIESNPFLFQIRYSQIRCAVISKFPYMVHYKIDEFKKSILIISVYNNYRKPKWDF